MTASRISARSLLRETFAAVGSVYVPLLIFNFLSLIFPVLIFPVLSSSFGNLGLVNILLNIIYQSCVLPLLLGAMIFYTYRSLTGNQVTIDETFQKAKKRWSQLILVYITSVMLIEKCVMYYVPPLNFVFFQVFIVLMIPVFYVSLYLLFRLGFSLFATILDDSSLLDSLSSSWQLTKGRWWLVLRSVFGIFLVAFVPIVLIALLIARTGKSPAFEIMTNVLGFLAWPLLNVYTVLLYLRLRESAATIK